jgi:soluble lytic murein transglycosylase-like protein
VTGTTTKIVAWQRVLCATVPLAMATPAAAEDDAGPRAALASYEAALTTDSSQGGTTSSAATAAPANPAVAAAGPRGVAQRLSRRSGSRPEAGLNELVARHAREQNVPEGIARGVIMVESRFNPQARNGGNLGLTQISYRTARAMGYAGSPAGLLDPETNLRFGLRYLGQAYRLAGGDTCRTILKFQSGHGAATMTSAARSYCNRVKTSIASAN